MSINLDPTPQETAMLVFVVAVVMAIVLLHTFSSSGKKGHVDSRKMKHPSMSVELQISSLEKAIEGVESDQDLKERMAEAISILPNLEA